MRRILSALALLGGCSALFGLACSSGLLGRRATGISVTLQDPGKALVLSIDNDQLASPLRLLAGKDGEGPVFLETKARRIWLTGAPIERAEQTGFFTGVWALAGGGKARVSIQSQGKDFQVRLSAEGTGEILKWGFAIAAQPDERLTGLMERTVDGDQRESWAPGISVGMDLRGQAVDMVVKPTLGLYTPFLLSSRGWGIHTHGTWPGHYDIGKAQPDRVQIEFEGPDLAFKIYTDRQLVEIVKRHALDVGPPLLPPRWAFRPIRWRDEHNHRRTYYDGTEVTAPYNSELVEDILMMEAYGIPCGGYWIDRPWGPGKLGYDDFTWDPARVPNPERMVKWLAGKNIKFMLWIAPWVNGRMAQVAAERGFLQAGQTEAKDEQPQLDFSNPEARRWWQDEGLAKVLKIGVRGFKLDRAEEVTPATREARQKDGRSARESRNDYPVQYVQATWEGCKKHLGSDDFFLFPRAAYTGSSRYGGVWGGDIAGPAEGLRAAIIAQQRAAVLGFPVWGSDTGGYHKEEREPFGRWLAFSAFSPLMEVGPTWNKAPWDAPWAPHYDAELIAIWRMYAILHDRLVDYVYAAAREASATGLPIVRPLFLMYPEQERAWQDWQTYLFGPDILVSPVWQPGATRHELYLPAGATWVDAWDRASIHKGGQRITVAVPLHRIPIYLRQGSTVDLGDLKALWQESQAMASRRPNLAELQRAVR